MGQKTHPKGFRLITTQNHLSEWYSNKLKYSSLIEEDFFIRETITKNFEDYLSIAKIQINRIDQNIENKEYVNITINALGNALAGSSAVLILTQDATGNRLLSSTMKFAGNSKTLSTAASSIDIMSVFYDGTTYYATLSKGYA
jgi:small subunit ribosomal protein S3